MAGNKFYPQLLGPKEIKRQEAIFQIKYNRAVAEAKALEELKKAAIAKVLEKNDNEIINPSIV